jgi:diguanylate cyclase (GGDEF)-like protein
VQVVRSIKQHRIDEAGLQQACHRDALTGLLDPVGFVRYLERQSAAAPHARLAVLCIDLALPDRSHVALDVAAQDRLLQLFAWRLGMLVRPADAVARLAERQFAVVLTDIAEPRFATAVADKVHAVASHPFALESGLAQVGVRVGMAWTAEPGESWGALLARADAMAAGAGAQDAGPAPANGWPASA